MALPSLAGRLWLARAETQAVFSALATAGFAARAVGGCVRNALLGQPVADVDVATPAEPQAVIEAATRAGLKAVPTGIDHGTITVVADGFPVEVTTLRCDVETFGRHATVAFTDDWAVDAARRDFTMNALYCGADGTIFDPLGGYGDLAAGRIRFIGDPTARIREDYLRILRFFRFQAYYGREALDQEGLLACVRERAGLAGLSAERVRSELVKLLAAPDPTTVVRTMSEHGFLQGLLGSAPRPGLFEAFAQAQADEGGIDTMARLSVLAVAVDEDIERLATRLRLSNDERQAMLVASRQLADQVAGLSDRGARRLLYKLGAARWQRAVAVAQSLAASARSDWKALADLPRRWEVPRFPIKGADVLALGVAPGRLVGDVLAEVEAWWIDFDFPAADQVRERLATVVKAKQPSP